MGNKTVGSKSFAHVWSSEIGEGVEITFDKVPPDEKKRTVEGLQCKYYGSVEVVNSNQIAQLESLGFHPPEAWQNSHLTSIRDAARIFPEVGKLVGLLERGGLKFRSFTETLGVTTSEPEKVINILKEYVTPQTSNLEGKG